MREKLKNPNLKRVLRGSKMGQRNQNDEVLLTNKIIANFTESVVVTPNGSNNVTISNVAPATVGTATIAKWLRVDDGTPNGTAYFIPMWT